MITTFAVCMILYLEITQNNEYPPAKEFPKETTL